MSAGVYTDMAIYQAEFQTGLAERISQNIAAFNAQSAGAIRLVPNALRGHYGKSAFFKEIASLVARRDISSVAAVSDLKMTQDEVISVKINRRVGPVAQTIDAIKKAGLTEAQASRAFGVFAADAKFKDMLNTALIAGERAIQDNTAMNLTISSESTPTMSTSALVRTLALMGDMAGSIVAWVGHSKPFYDLTKALVIGTATGVADAVTVNGPISQSLGRPFIVTDAPALTDANGSADDTYNTLGLVRDAIIVEESEEEAFFTDIISGNANLLRRWQAEYAYNLSVKGFKWDVAVGVNPTDANVGASGSWDQVATSDKLTAGVRLVSE
jgi:hypothetical protein